MERVGMKPAEVIYARLTDQSQPLVSAEFHQLIERRKEFLLAYRIETQALKEELRQVQN